MSSSHPAIPVIPEPAPRPDATPNRPRRRWRWVLRVLVGVPLLAACAALVLMRSPLIGRIVVGQVRLATGGELVAGRTVITAGGQLLITDLRLRVPGVEGPAGQVLSASQAIADIRWSRIPPMRWFGGSVAGEGPPVTVLRLTNPVFRISQSADDGTITLSGLTPAASGASTGELPRIDVIDGRVEFAEHSPSRGSFDLLNAVEVGGSLLPVPGAGGPTIRVSLQETGRAPAADGGQRGMILDGHVDLAHSTASLRLLYVSLDAWPPESVPVKFREQWRRLAVQGQVEETRFDYAPDKGVSVAVKVKDVSIVVPVPSENQADDDGYLSLRRVDGVVGLSGDGLTAELEGRIENQAGVSHVSLRTRGLDLDSGFRCEISGRGLNVSRTPEFLPYVPPIVRQYLEWFGGPTADVDARVIIERDDPADGQPAPITVPDGDLRFRNGRAAFHKFPYPFHDMAGVVRFDDRTIRMIEITGVGPAGSPLTASGTISPLTQDSQVDVKIEVNDVPLDDELLAAMRPEHRRLTEVIFSRERWRELVRAGLVRQPGDPEPDPGLPEPPPEFAFGGAANIRVHVQRPLGDEVEWTTDVRVSFPRAGLVPEPFPFPIVATDLVLGIHDDRAVLEDGIFTGLSGGEAQVEASVVFGDPSRGTPTVPDVRIAALDVPVSTLLLNAVPGRAPDAPEPASGTLDAKSILDRLDLRGLVDCEVMLGPPAAPAPAPDLVGPVLPFDVDYTVVVRLDNLTAAPRRSAEQGLCVRELSGTLAVTPRGVNIDGLVARLGRLGPEADDRQLPPCERRNRFASAAPAGELLISLEAESMPEGSAEQGRLAAAIALTDLDLRDPIEDATGVFSEDAAAYLREVRRTRAPEGRISASITLDADRAATPTDGGGDGRPVRIGVTVGRTEGLAVSALGGRLELESPAGAVRITTAPRPTGAAAAGASGGTRLHFDELTADLRFNGGEAGRLRLNGGLTTGDDDHPARGPADLTSDLIGWRFESGLTESILREFGGERVVEDFQRPSPQGRFDARVELRGPAPPEEHQLSVSGSITPRSLRVVHQGIPIEFAELDGRLTFDSPAPLPGRARTIGGRLENARARTAAWSAEGGGSWAMVRPTDQPAGFSIESDFSAEVREFDAALRSLLPDTVGAAVDRLALTFDQPLRLHGCRIRALLPEDPLQASAVVFGGSIDFDGMSLRLDEPHADPGRGLRITGARGRADVWARSAAAAADGAPPGSLSDEPLLIGFRVDRLRFAGVELTDARATLAQSLSGALHLRNAVAACHHGRVMAEAEVDAPPPPAADAPGAAEPAGGRPYRVSALMCGVNFAPLLEDLARPDGPAIPAAPAASADTTRGNVDARLALAGTLSPPGAAHPGTRRGRGAIRIANGDVIRLPLMLPLMQMSNLVLPLGDRLNFLSATFHIDGPTATFDDVHVSSDSISIVGAGTVTLPDLALDMRFNTRANRRVPLWSDLFEAVRNEIVTTVVTGTIDRPVIRTETLGTTRRALEDMMNPE